MNPINTMNASILLQAFKGTNRQIPVWFMRQAGRYLPSYQKIRAQYPLKEMFQNPDLASTITVQPVDILGVDAAILFADILTLPQAMGASIEFDNQAGPVVTPISAGVSLHEMNDLPDLRKTIQLTKEKLANRVPLIGFAGSPFTVLTYLIEGGSSVNFHKTFSMMHKESRKFHELMELLTVNTIKYLKLQKENGVDVFQLFDSWGGILRPADYAHFVLPYVCSIFEEVDLPSIYYLKNCAHLLPIMDKTEAEFLSVCQTVVLGHQTTIEKTKKGIQGNFFNGLLYAPKETIEKEAHDVVMGGLRHKRFIFNLNHGIFPDVNPDALKWLVEKVHSYKVER